MSADTAGAGDFEQENHLQIVFLKLAVTCEVLVVCGLVVLAVLLILH